MSEGFFSIFLKFYIIRWFGACFGSGKVFEPDPIYEPGFLNKMNKKIKNKMLFIRSTTSRLASPESVPRRLASPKNPGGGHHMIGYEGKTTLNKKILQKKAQDILKITLPRTQKVQVHPGAG